MHSTTLASPSHLRPDEKSLAEYRSVSRMAVAAACLGIASAVVLLTPLLVPVAVAAILIAVLALRAIAASGGQLVGRLPAMAGLSLAVLFLSWGTSRHLSRQAALETAARQVVAGWLRLIQEGQLEQAHQLRQAPERRLSSPEALQESYKKNPDAAKELQGFTSQNGVKALIAAGPSARLEYGGLTSAQHDGFSDQLQLKFTLERSPEQGGPLPLWINIARRHNDQTRRAHWEPQSIDTNPPQLTQ